MARTHIVPAAPPLSGPGRQFFPALPISAGTLTLSMTATDATNFNFSEITDGRLWLLFNNTDVSSHTITIHSVADASNRTGDITTYSVAAGGLVLVGPFTNAGWGQPASPGPAGLYYDTNSALIFVAAILMPA